MGLWACLAAVLMARGAPVVFVPLDAIRPPPEEEPAPEPRWLADRLEVELRPGKESALSLRWTLRPLAPGWVDLPLVGGALALSEATVDGQPVSLAPGPDGLSHLVLYLDRPRRIALRGTLPTPGASLDLRVAGAVRRTLRVLGPWEATVEGAVASRERFDGGSPDRLAVRWKPEGPKPPRPTLLRAESSSALRLDSAGLEATAILRYRVHHGSVDRVRFRLPAGTDGLEVAGDGVLDFAREGELVVVRLARPVSDRLDLRVSFRAPPPRDEAAALPLPWPEAADPSGFVTLLRGDEALVVPSPGSGAEAISSRAVPAWGQGLADGAPIASYRLSGDPRVDARLVTWEPVEGPPTVVDEARYEVATAEHGRLILRARFQVRNDRRQFLRLDVPDELALIGVSVAGRAVVAARDSDGRLLIPLEKSVETLSGLVTFPVDIAFWGSDGPWSGRALRHLRTPAVDAPVAYARWELVLPPGFAAKEVEGNARLVPDWSSREGGLSYGRAYGEALEEEAEEQVVVEGRSFSTVLASVPGVGGRGSRRDAKNDADKDTATPQAAPTGSTRDEESSQVYWNEAYTAYKENRFDDARELLDQSLALNPDNQAAQALQGNVDVLLDSSGESGEDEAAARRVKEMAKAKTASTEIQQEALQKKAEEALRAGDYEAAERTLQDLVQVSGVLASVEQSELVEKKEVYRQASSQLASVRQRLGRGSGGGDSERATRRPAPVAAPPPAAAEPSSEPAATGNGPDLPFIYELSGAEADDRVTITENQIVILESPPEASEALQALGYLDAEPLIEELPLLEGYATVILEDEEAARQLQEALVVEPDIADLLTGQDLVWTGDEDLRTEVVFETLGLYGYGSGAAGSADGYGSGRVHGRAAVAAVPVSFPIPRAGQVLRFEARLVPEGVPLSVDLSYRPARDRRAR